jgi:hypothetical protein
MKNKLLTAALAATAITAGVIYYKKKRKARRSASATEPGNTARPDNGSAERGRTFNQTPSTSF